MPTFRHLLRLAIGIRETLQSLARHRGDIGALLWSGLENAYREVLKNRRYLDVANKKDWHGIASTLRTERIRHAKQLQSAINELASLADEPSELPSLADLLAELNHLQEEFGDLRIGWKEKVLGVTTDPVTLENIELGPFSISLHWPRLGKEASAECFEVEALEPNPASINDQVTHPHVRDGVLCAGEATVPIKRALEQGRLVDAFLLVKGVLTNYNPHSVHVSLDDWEGYVCADCGRVVREGDHAYCEACDLDYCDDCVTTCHACRHGRCRTCLEPCADCDELCCPGCLHVSACTDRECCRHCLAECAACGGSVGRSELDESDSCSMCREIAEISQNLETNPDFLSEVSHEITAVP